MKALAVAILASILLPIPGSGQQETWHSEGRDAFLVAPYATQVNYVRGALDTLTYIVVVRYPATDVVTSICRDLQQKGWKATMGCTPGTQTWKYIPGGVPPPYYLELSFVSEGGDELEYNFSYDEPLPGEHGPQVLHVKAEFISGYEISPPPPRPLAFVTTGVLRAVWALIGLAMILGPIFAFQSPNVTSRVFYVGPDSWVTWWNLIFFAPAALAFFACAVFILSIQLFLQFGKIDQSINASIAGSLAGFLVMLLIGKISFVLCPVSLFLTYRTLSAERIPGKVKNVQLMLNLATLAFFSLCGYLAYFADNRLIGW